MTTNCSIIQNADICVWNLPDCTWNPSLNIGPDKSGLACSPAETCTSTCSNPWEECVAGNCRNRDCSDCSGAGVVCDGGGYCVPGECTSNADCTSPEVCELDSFTCYDPSAPTCTTDGDCVGAEECAHGACAIPEGSCNTSSDCGRLEVCFENACVSNQCTTDMTEEVRTANNISIKECPGAMVCGVDLGAPYAHTCAYAEGTCERNSHCGLKQTCVLSTNQCRDICTSDADCPNGTDQCSALNVCVTAEDRGETGDQPEPEEEPGDEPVDQDDQKTLGQDLTTTEQVLIGGAVFIGLLFVVGLIIYMGKK
jgi:hypothetical protein